MILKSEGCVTIYREGYTILKSEGSVHMILNREGKE